MAKRSDNNPDKPYKVKVGRVVAALIVVLLGIVFFSNTSSQMNNSFDGNRSTDTLDKVERQSTPKLEIKAITSTEAIPYTSSTVSDATLDEGSIKTRVFGVNGQRTDTYDVTYTDGVETNRIKVDSMVTTEPVNEVVARGTKQKPASNCDPNYTPCIPYVSYDLDCSDIGMTVRVIGTDRHRFDRDKDGWGCESY
ncbi:MAG TPA: G5 domain-containing protein [Candidatus Saccharibacteria bacterium]|nr:G5 domain-containing protein [Candidatus Saccharibacteria bacterium]